ncbi:hypothetical protein IW138_006038 [Coemansia sp. RSA 986]|nr:hypothetical protein IW138_006038 [Coemansia sp. RSA 986]
MALPPPYTSTASGPSNSSGNQPEEYYHPASFPGYTVVQIATGQENQPLLPRLIRQQRRRQRQRGRGCRRLCSHLCGCLCLGISLFVVLGLVTGTLGFMRGMFPSPPPSQSWSCSSGSMDLHTDAVFGFPMDAPLHIESTEGINLSRVHLVKHTGRSKEVTVRAVVETEENRGTVWGDRITVVARNSTSDTDSSSLVVHATRPRWGWPYGCIRATLYIDVPSEGEEAFTGLLAEQNVLPMLYVRTATGTLTAVDLGTLRANNVDIGIKNGNANIHNTTTSGSLIVRTSNGAIRMRTVKAQGAIDVHTSNGPISAEGISAASVTAETSNGSIKGDIVIGEAATIKTSNSAVDVDIQGISSNEKTVSISSSNAPVSASVAGIGGNFLARTSNSHAEVTSNNRSQLHFTLVTNTIKQGVFSTDDHPEAGSINVGSSNGRVSLSFSS